MALWACGEGRSGEGPCGLGKNAGRPTAIAKTLRSKSQVGGQVSLWGWIPWTLLVVGEP